MAKVIKTFKTKEELWKYISTETLPNANVSGLVVEYEEVEEQEVTGCVGCNINYQPEEELVGTPDTSLEDARAAYEEKAGKSVPNNKKNDLEWLENYVKSEK